MSQPNQPTVRVRIAVLVSHDGSWSAFGHSDDKDNERVSYAAEGLDPGEACLSWVEADVPRMVSHPTSVVASSHGFSIWRPSLGQI